MKYKFIFLSFLFVYSHAYSQQESIDLSGEWLLSFDSTFNYPSSSSFDKKIIMPGSIQQQGLGNPFSINSKWLISAPVNDWKTNPFYTPYRISNNLKFPYWLQPETVYTGVAWYKRELVLDLKENNKKYFLFLERVHWESQLYINGSKVGCLDSLCVPHQYDITSFLKNGKNLIVVKIDNNYIYNIGKNSHSISDHTQGNWNGFIGEIKINIENNCFIEKVSSRFDGKNILISVDSCGVKNSNNRFIRSRLLSNSGDLIGVTEPVKLKKNSKLIYYPKKEIQLWDEFNPTLYQIETEIYDENQIYDLSIIKTGFRIVGINFDEKRISVNGINRFLRGTVDCALFPQTGYPPMTQGEWIELFELYNSYGLNHLRFHSWCPPKAAFLAADKLGFYLQIEGPSWCNADGAKLGYNKASRFIKKELYRILYEYGHHPSFLMMAYGNEPGGPFHRSWLKKLVLELKEADPYRLYTTAAGWPAISQNDYQNIPAPRIQDWGEGLNSVINAKLPSTDYNFNSEVTHFKVPVVSHEIGQWCVYPDFNEIDNYKGHLKAKNFEIFSQILNRNIPGDYSTEFFMASGNLQTLCYKADIEAALRTDGFGGFQLLGLQDFSGQGTALVGVVNALYEPKKYTNGESFRKFCSPVVPLARFNRRTFSREDKFSADIEVANYSNLDIVEKTVWNISDEKGKVYFEGGFSKKIPVGERTALGSIKLDFSKIKKTVQLELTIIVDENYSNSWPIYVYNPHKKVIIPEGSSVCYTINGLKKAIDSNDVKNILFLASDLTVKNKIKVGFSTVFWNTKWTNNQPPHTLGFYLDNSHPIWTDFPTENWQDWRWWHLTKGATAMEIKYLPRKLNSIVMPIDSWFTARRLSFLFEADVKGKRIVVSSFNTKNDKEPSVQAFISALESYTFLQKKENAVEIQLEVLLSLFR